MKTPIQELIDSVGNMAQGLDAEELYDYFTKKATELLEKERKVKKTVEERAEEEYPLIDAEGFGGANAIIMRQREAYIKGATDNQEQRVDESDIEERTITIEIEQDCIMELTAGRVVIVPEERYKQLVNGLSTSDEALPIADVVKRLWNKLIIIIIYLPSVLIDYLISLTTDESYKEARKTTMRSFKRVWHNK